MAKTEQTKAAPENWVEVYGDYLFSLALTKIANRETAEDLVQETFLSAIKNLDSFRGDSSERTWLTAILRNKIIDYYRKKDLLHGTADYLDETEGKFYNQFFDPGSAQYGHWLPSTAPGYWSPAADSDLRNKEFHSIVQSCMDKMPSKLLPIFIARYMDDMESEVICKEFGISSSNYWVILHRAKILMRACLENKWFRS